MVPQTSSLQYLRKNEFVLSDVFLSVMVYLSVVEIDLRSFFGKRTVSGLKIGVKTKIGRHVLLREI